MLILVYNPDYNTLKVAGGTVAGLTRKAESMIPAAEKNRKTTYFYDMFNKKLIYVADSRSKLSKVLNMSKGFFSNYINKRYLDRFYITNTLLDSYDYSNNLKSNKDILDLVKSHKRV
jgi:hypothetical protein